MNDDQLLRYSRHILLPQIDVDGQERLLAAHVLVVGAGGLGSPAEDPCKGAVVLHSVHFDFNVDTSQPCACCAARHPLPSATPLRCRFLATC